MNEEQASSQEPGLEPGSAETTGAPAAQGAGGVETGGTSPAGSGRRDGWRFATRTVVVVGVAALIAVAAILAASRGSGSIRIVLAGSQNPAAVSGAEITVTGSGQVEGTPDTATFGIGVTTTAHSAVSALEQNNSQVATLEQSLEQSGVALKDIQTSWLNLSTNTNNNGDVTGFSADDELSVTMHDLSNLGAALDAAVHATGNGISLGGISFSITNQSALLAAARAQAMLSARTEADQLAAGGGLALGSIVKVTDQENAGQYVYFGAANQLAPTASGVPVQPGQQQISVEVTVVYQLKST